MNLDDTVAAFIADEQGAIDQLRLFVGGAAAPALDFSFESFSILDAFLRNLTSQPNWSRSPLYDGVSESMEKWLAVRVAYYLAASIRALYGSEWQVCTDPEDRLFRTPILAVGNTSFSPLEVGHAAVLNELDRGLPGFLKDLADSASENGA